MKTKTSEKVARYVAGAESAAERALARTEQVLGMAKSVEQDMGAWLHTANKSVAAVKRTVETAKTKVRDSVKAVTNEPILAETKRIDDAAVAAKDALAVAVAETRKVLDAAVAEVNKTRDEALTEIQTALDGLVQAQTGIEACVTKAVQIVAEVQQSVQACSAARGSIKDATARLAAATSPVAGA